MKNFSRAPLERKKRRPILFWNRLHSQTPKASITSTKTLQINLEIIRKAPFSLIKIYRNFKLILANFIQILKTFTWFIVFYLQPKIEILRCDNSTPLNRNLIPRFEETWEKDKVDLQVFILIWFVIDEIWDMD
jgi:hypothetical protein